MRAFFGFFARRLRFAAAPLPESSAAALIFPLCRPAPLWLVFAGLSVLAFCLSACQVKYSVDDLSLLQASEQRAGLGDEDGEGREEAPKGRSLCRDSSLPGCRDSSSCREICDEIFSHKKRENCYRAPESLVESFEETLRIMQKEDFESIDSDVLECLLKIDNKKFARTVGKLSKTESKEFLLKIAADRKLAEILEKGDENSFRILREAFRAIAPTVKKAVRERIYGSFNFLALIGRNDNRYAYKWLDDLAEDECADAGNSCASVIKDYYCPALTDLSRSDLRDFLRSRFFEDAYGKKVERATCGSKYCEYEDAEDFKAFCRGL